MVSAAIVLIVVGLACAGFGMLAAMDAEGRGGWLLALIPVGLVCVVAGAGCLVYRLIAWLLS